jgi:EAL domain-containing protein (putative c-di-GMP-specific phosphodiesterase class I)
VRATTALGHALRLRVVAEGIEDKATLDLVSELGCDLAQGYFISKPCPARELVFGQAPAATPPALDVSPQAERKSRQLVRSA